MFVPINNDKALTYNIQNHQEMKVYDVITFVNTNKQRYVTYERSQMLINKYLGRERVVTVKKTYQRSI